MFIGRQKKHPTEHAGPPTEHLHVPNIENTETEQAAILDPVGLLLKKYYSFLSLTQSKSHNAISVRVRRFLNIETVAAETTLTGKLFYRLVIRLVKYYSVL